MTGAKCDLRNEQQREKREESREKREARREKREERSEKRETSTIKMRGWKDAKVRSQKGGMVPKRVGPWEGEGREQRKERREKRSQKRPPEIPKLIDSRVCWPLGRLESLHFYRVGGLEAS